MAGPRDPLRKMSLNFTVAGQSGEWIGVPRRLDLLRGDLAQQVECPAKSEVDPVARDNEIIPLRTGAAGGDHAADLVEPRARLDLNRLPCHHAADRFAIVDFG